MASQQETPLCRDIGPVPLTPAQRARKGDWLRLHLVKAPPVLQGPPDMAQVDECFDVCPFDAQETLFACYGVASGQNGAYFVVSEWALGRCFDTQPCEVEKRETLGGDSSPATEERKETLTATATTSPPEMAEQLQMDLSEQEVDQLRQCEAVIERGKQTFLEVGSSLLTIQENRLYRATHPTFEKYMTERWSISRNYAYRLIGAAETAQALLPIGNIVLENEHQARQIKSLTAEQQQAAYALAKDNAPDAELAVTGKAMLDAAQSLSVSAAETQADTPPDAAAQVAPSPSALREPMSEEAQLEQADALGKRLQTYLSTEGEVVGTTTSPEENEETEETSSVADDTGGNETMTQTASAMVSTLEAASSPAPLLPSETAAPVSVVDKRERREEASEGTGTTAVSTTAATPATTNSPQPTLPSSAPAATSVSPMVMAMLPRDENEWLQSQGLTVGLAIAELRALRQTPQGTFGAYKLAPDAQEALQTLQDDINANRNTEQGTKILSFAAMKSIRRVVGDKETATTEDILNGLVLYHGLH